MGEYSWKGMFTMNENLKKQLGNLMEGAMTIPNLLSLFRLILIPVYVVIYLNATEPVHYYTAGGILAECCLADGDSFDPEEIVGYVEADHD